MSKLSALLGERMIQSSLLVADRQSTTLDELRLGQHAMICDVSGEVDHATARRMIDLGFAPGTGVQLIRRAPLSDPLMFRVAGYQIALRRAQARCINVVTTA